MSGRQEAVSAVRLLLDGLPTRPLPEVGDLELASALHRAEPFSGTLVDAVSLHDGRVALALFEYGGDGEQSGACAALAWGHTLRSMLCGALPHTALVAARDEVLRRAPSATVTAAAVAIIDIRDNLVNYSSLGEPAPLVYRKELAGPLPVQDTRRATVRALGAELDETRVYLKAGDWLLLCSPGAAEVCHQRTAKRAGPTVPYRWLSSSSATRFATMFEERARRLDARGKLHHDAAVAAVRVPPVSTRIHLLRELGFAPDDPVTLASLHFFEDMDGAAAGVLRAMDRQGYRDSAIRQMKVTLAELLVNALEHGNCKDPDKRVVLGYVVDEKQAVVSVLDEGEGFDPQSVPDPTAEENLGLDRGRGLFLVRNFVDSVQHNRVGNRVTVTKAFSA